MKTRLINEELMPNNSVDQCIITSAQVFLNQISMHNNIELKYIIHLLGTLLF